MIQMIVVKDEELMCKEGEKECLTASYANSLSKIPEHALSIHPVHTGIGNRLTISQSLFALRPDILTTFDQITLNHQSNNRLVPIPDLVGQICRDRDLIPVLLSRVSVRAIDHDDLGEFCLDEAGADGGDVFLLVVGAAVSTAEDQMAELIALCVGDSCETLLGDAQEVMRLGSSTNSIDRNSNIPVSPVLEAQREAHSGG